MTDLGERNAALHRRDDELVRLQAEKAGAVQAFAAADAIAMREMHRANQAESERDALKARHESALREVSEWQRDFKTLAKACGGILGAENTKRELAEARREIERLREALADAPDMTCESLEARAWREKYAHLFATPSAPAQPDGPYLCSARKGGTDAGDPCMRIEGHEGRHTFAKLRPFATSPTPRTEKGDTYPDGSPRYQDDPTPPAREGGEGMRAHRGDPCMYCHTRHDDVAVGPCPAAPRCPPHAYPWPGRIGSLCLTCGDPRPAPEEHRGDAIS